MQFSKKWMASLLGLTTPYLAHAEAFKGGLLSAGSEKAIFFIFLLLLIFVFLGIGNFFRKLVDREKKDNTSIYFLLAIVGFVLFLAMIGS